MSNRRGQKLGPQRGIASDSPMSPALLAAGY